MIRSVQEIQAKSILIKSKLPDTDYVINPYMGCAFGCVYCYASFMGRFVQEKRSNWGNYLYVKTNTLELLEKELASWPYSKQKARILLSSVTDPYQGAEKKYRLTRRILEFFLRKKYPGKISILTKSPLVLRDLDLLERLSSVSVGLTITTTDDRITRFLEGTAPLSSRRFDTLKKFNDCGLSTYAFIGPLLPHFRYYPELLDQLFNKIAITGTRDVYIEHINLSAPIRERLWTVLKYEPLEVQHVYQKAITQEHRNILDNLIEQLVQKYHFKLLLNKTLYHSADKK